MHEDYFKGSWKRRKKKIQKPRNRSRENYFSKSQRAFRVCADEDAGDGVSVFWLVKRGNRGCKYSTLSYFGKPVAVWFDHEVRLIRGLILALLSFSHLTSQ